MAAARDAETPRDYLGASILGDACERAIQYRHLQVAPDLGKGFPPRVLRCFDRGRWAEDYAIALLKRSGFVLLEHDPDTGEQWAFETMRSFWRGENGKPSVNPSHIPGGKTNDPPEPPLAAKHE